MNQEELRRLVNKSDRQLFINDLITGFGLSKVEAEALCARVTLFNRDYYEGSRGPGQKAKTVADWGEQRASLYCIAERKVRIRNCGCVTNR
jgi:hypothetical protein